MEYARINPKIIKGTIYLGLNWIKNDCSFTWKFFLKRGKERGGGYLNNQSVHCFRY